jgi:hypothetical protein
MARKAANGDATTTGAGGETHQTAGRAPTLTTQQGVPVADDQNTLRAGDRGPAALEDFHLRERSSTSTTSGSRSESSTPGATAPADRSLLSPVVANSATTGATGVDADGQAADFSRMWTPQAEPRPMTWARPTVAPSIWRSPASPRR